MKRHTPILTGLGCSFLVVVGAIGLGALSGLVILVADWVAG